VLLVAWTAIVWQIAPFALTVSRAQSPQAPAPQVPPQGPGTAPNPNAPPLPPSPQCTPPAILAAIPSASGSGRFTNPFTGRFEFTTLAVCVLAVAPEGDCPTGSVALSVPGASRNICVVPAACPSGYALTSTWCCPSGQATSQGLCCPPGQSPQPNGLCGSAHAQ